MTQSHDAIGITGVGIHSAWGDDDATVSALKKEQTAVRVAALEQSPSFPETPGAPAAPFKVREYLKDRKLAKYMNQTTAMSVVAAGRALDSAGVRDDSDFCGDLALFMAVGMTVFDITSVGPAALKSRNDAGELDLKLMGSEGLRACHPLMPFKSLLNMPLGMVSIAHGIGGHNFVTYPGVEQSGSCLAAALRGIRAGRFERALVGGSSQGVSLMTLGTLVRRKLVAQSAEEAVPYSERHRGIAPGDGSAFLILERLETAQKKGRRVYGVLSDVSCGRSFDEQSSGRLGSRNEHWAAVAGEQIPELFLSCGNLNHEDELAELSQLERLFGGATIPRLSFDGAAGELGPAGLFFALGVTAHALQLGESPSILGTPDAPSVLVSAGDVNGGHAAALLSAWEGLNE